MKNRTFESFPHGRRPRRGRTRLFVLSAVVAASGAASASATALPADDSAKATAALAAKTARFEIRPGPLAAVLAEFERVTGVKAVVGDAGLLTIQSAGVSGTLSIEQAMTQLLAGTSLQATFLADGRVRVGLGTMSEFVDVVGRAPAPASPKYTQSLRDTPQTIVVIPQTVYQQQGATSLRDALRNTPGITLTAGEGGTAPGDNLLIRGFSARNDVYLDGARDPGVVSRDTFNTEAVEVAKGPSSVVAGRGSTGGSVNLVTKAASLTDSTDVRLIGGSAEYRRGTADVNRKLGQHAALRVNGMWQDAGVPGREAVQNTSWGVAPTLSLGLATPTQVTLSYQHLRQNNVPDHGLPATLPDLAVAAGKSINDIAFDRFYGLRGRDHETVRSDVGTATIHHRVSNALTLRNLTRYSQNHLDRIVTSPRAATVANAGTDPGFNAAVAQIRRTDAKYQNRDDRTLTNQTDATLKFTTASLEHSLVAGLELARDRQPSYAVTDAFTNGRPPVTDLFNPNPEQAYVPALVRTGATADATSVSRAVYAFDTVKINDHWQADLGMRWDAIDVDYGTVAAVTGARATFSRHDTAPSGRAALVYKPVARGSIYTAYSTSFNPSFDGSFGLTLSSAGATSVALPPEKSHNVEVGTKWDMTKSLFVTAALFRTEKTNAKTTDAAGVTVLAGNQQVTGIELGLNGNLTSRWGVFSGISLMDGSVQESAVAAEVGRQLSYVPKTSFNLWTTYRVPVVGVTVGGGAQFTDGYFFNNTNALPTANAAAIQALTKYWLFNGVAMYQLNRHVGLQVNATNLANERYVERGYAGHFIPGPGRAVLVSSVLGF